ncbi:hypothetical protein WMY93_007901 [Mugilogobius chulae]|uniref:Ciliary neurotrophic factor n=1 Tax=Mugilogobius chulae TaxID=88201 RepID=A0AAW0PEJ8_9GOBI
MTFWQQAFLLCFSLSCVHCLPSAVLHTKYTTSYRLKEEQLGSKDYEDRSQHLKDLPSLSTDFYTWLKLTDEERLGTALSDMQAFWGMLEWKREQLSSADTHSTLPQIFQHIEYDLRDLIRQVNHQETAHYRRAQRGHPQQQPHTWDSRVEGYIILRDLDLYLTKLARDFLLLATKTTHHQTNGKSNRKS